MRADAFAFPAHRSGRSDSPNPAFRLSSCQAGSSPDTPGLRRSSEWRPHTAMRDAWAPVMMAEFAGRDGPSQGPRLAIDGRVAFPDAVMRLIKAG